MQPKPIIGYSIYAYKGGRKEKYFRETRNEAVALSDALRKLTTKVYFKEVRFLHNKNNSTLQPGTGNLNNVKP
jgi:hypothetical protein